MDRPRGIAGHFRLGGDESRKAYLDLFWWIVARDRADVELVDLA